MSQKFKYVVSTENRLITSVGYFAFGEDYTPAPGQKVVESHLRPEELLRYALDQNNNLVYVGVPSEYETFDGDKLKWVYDISLHKQHKWNEIKAARDRCVYGGFYWNGLKFDSDQTSQSRILVAMQSAAVDDSVFVEWTLADNTSVAMTAADILSVGRALFDHVNTCHSVATALRAEIDAATSREVLDAIVWPEPPGA